MIRFHAMPFGAECRDDGSVRFRLWAPAARQVELCLCEALRQLPMKPCDQGWFEIVSDAAVAGELYKFRMDGGREVPDPASRFQPHDVHGPSQVVNPAAFEWQDGGWRGRRWEEAVIYELHVGAFTHAGGFAAVQERPREYPRILHQAASSLAEKLGEQDLDLLELQSLMTAFGHLPGRHEPSSERVAERNRDKEIHKRRLAELCTRAPAAAHAIAAAVNTINGDSLNPASFEELHELIKAQAFRLANWRVASDDINYRRFFDSNDLAGICMENETVFQQTHRLILHLVVKGKVDGLRIDHPDGLYDPAQYFERLQRNIAAARENAKGNARCYVVIEKILTGQERLPAQWPISGTTGYEFANLVNGLFVDTLAVLRMERTYRKFLGEEIDFADLAYRCRRLIMRVGLASELNVLASQLTRIALAKRRTCDFTLNSLQGALTEVVASFPVYRTYVSPGGVSATDAQYIQEAVSLAKRRSPAADTSIFDFLADVLLTRIADGQDAAYRHAVTSFAMKFQQFTSPVMAKGLEDTAFYRFHRLVSLNEVGGDLHRFGATPAEFHLANQERLRDWPHTLLATSTHDSKRSEDVRARINVLPEISGLWRLRLRDWRRFNRTYKGVVNGKPAPSPNEEYLLYQTLVGAWPFESLDDKERWNDFRVRIENYMLKAIREAKENTSWINRNTEYEEAVVSFVRKLLSPGARNRFLNDFIPFQRRVARLGRWNSLSQTLLKLTCPGVPDIYQGNELWDFSLVDPDNRRPVDYQLRGQLFESLRSYGSTPSAMQLSSLLESPEDGRTKMYVIWKALCLRRQQPDLFERGDYLPLTVEGAKAGHVFAFARACEGANAVVIVPRLVAGLLSDSEVAPLGEQVWEDTRVVIPGSCAYRNAFTGCELRPQQDSLSVAQALSQFPVALLFRAI